ncbi:MAG TPA: hypothetical protein PLL20_18860 [Phycisphaerae bacterium]|nr:hypothetical protein [Phycisphaerae bacterium]HRR86452.1 hypothetical protein [Phycisphaerae bacterium]
MDDLGFTGSTSRSTDSLPAATDIELFCPHCDYNLRGLCQDRCPECGNHFNRERLIRWSTEPNLPLGFTRSDNPDQHGRVLTNSMTRPARLARELPPMPCKAGATTYGWAMRGAGVFVIFMAAAIMSYDADAAGYALLFSVGPVVGTLFCEAIIALLLARLVEPLAVLRGAEYRFWRTLCACFSTYFPISCAVVLFLPRIFIEIADSSATLDDFVIFCLQLAMMTIPALMILWWWLALAKAITARGRASSGRTAAVWLIPVVGLVSVGVGFALDYLLAMILL